MNGPQAIARDVGQRLAVQQGNRQAFRLKEVSSVEKRFIATTLLCRFPPLEELRLLDPRIVELWKHILDRPVLLAIDRWLVGRSHAASERREAKRADNPSGRSAGNDRNVDIMLRCITNFGNAALVPPI